MAESEKHRSDGLLLLKTAATLFAKQCDLKTRLALRSTCKALRAAVNQTLTSASLDKDRNGLLPTAFLTKGWPQSVDHLRLNARLLHRTTMLSLVQASYPRLRHLDIVFHYTSRFISELRAASYSWPLLCSLKIHNVAVTDLETLLQGRWSVTSFDLMMYGDTIIPFDEDDEVLPFSDKTTAAMWERAFPNISSMTFKLGGYNDDPVEHFPPKSLMEADFCGRLKLLQICPAYDSPPWVTSERMGWNPSEEAWWAFSDVAALGSASWLHSLEELHLGLCDINLHPLMTALEGSTSLTRLRLGVCTISTEGGYKLPSLENLQELIMFTKGGIVLFESIYDVCLPSITMMDFGFYPEREFKRVGSFARMKFERILFNDMPRLQKVKFDAFPSMISNDEWKEIVMILPKHIDVGKTWE